MAEGSGELPDSLLHAALDAYEQAEELELIHLDPPALAWIGEDPPYAGVELCAYLTQQRVVSSTGRVDRLSCGAAAHLCDYHSHAVHRAALGKDVTTLQRCARHRGRLHLLCRHCLHTSHAGHMLSPYDLVAGYVAAPLAAAVPIVVTGDLLE